MVTVLPDWWTNHPFLLQLRPVDPSELNTCRRVPSVPCQFSQDVSVHWVSYIRTHCYLPYLFNPFWVFSFRPVPLKHWQHSNFPLPTSHNTVLCNVKWFTELIGRPMTGARLFFFVDRHKHSIKILRLTLILRVLASTLLWCGLRRHSGRTKELDFIRRSRRRTAQHSLLRIHSVSALATVSCGR